MKLLKSKQWAASRRQHRQLSITCRAARGQYRHARQNKTINFQSVRSCECMGLLFRPVDPSQTIPLLGCQCRKVLLCFTRFSRRHFLSLITTRRSRAETPSSSAGSSGERHTARLHGKSRRGDERIAPPNQRRKTEESETIKNFSPGWKDAIRCSKSFRGGQKRSPGSSSNVTFFITKWYRAAIWMQITEYNIQDVSIWQIKRVSAAKIKLL